MPDIALESTDANWYLVRGFPPKWQKSGPGIAGRISRNARAHIFHFEFFAHAPPPPRFEQVNGAIANEIKHVHSPEVMVVLDPRYD